MHNVLVQNKLSRIDIAEGILSLQVITISGSLEDTGSVFVLAVGTIRANHPPAWYEHRGTTSGMNWDHSQAGRSFHSPSQ